MRAVRGDWGGQGSVPTPGAAPDEVYIGMSAHLLKYCRFLGHC
jgi:hypothetical protein